MRQKSENQKPSSERIVKEIRRGTRKHTRPRGRLHHGHEPERDQEGVEQINTPPERG
jgi:hypothetical protein